MPAEDGFRVPQTGLGLLIKKNIPPLRNVTMGQGVYFCDKGLRGQGWAVAIMDWAVMRVEVTLLVE